VNASTKKTKPEPQEKTRLSDLQNANNDGKGFFCRRCGCRQFFVVYTRPAQGAIRRVRECRSCGQRIQTTERT
jgi:hypothetical protein